MHLETCPDCRGENPLCDNLVHRRNAEAEIHEAVRVAFRDFDSTVLSGFMLDLLAVAQKWAVIRELRMRQQGRNN